MESLEGPASAAPSPVVLVEDVGWEGEEEEGEVEGGGNPPLQREGQPRYVLKGVGGGWQEEEEEKEEVD